MFAEKKATEERFMPFYKQLRNAWCKESCSPSLRENWPNGNIAKGQCFVTAAAVQETFGGEVFELNLSEGEIHYYNILDGEIVDFTSEQFGKSVTAEFYRSGKPSDVAHKMNDPIKRSRYAVLINRMKHREKDGQRLPMEIRVNTLTPELFLDLYASVGWEPPCIEQVRIALSNTLATFTCCDKGCPVGMVRVIGDGGMSFYIKDFAVVPAYQGKGAGKLLMTALEDYVQESKPDTWAVSLELISSKEAVQFYKKYGFEERPCDWDGPGMFKMVR